MTDAEQREAARQFVNRWMGKGKEDEDGRSYWIDLLTNVLGMDNVTERLNFEKKVVIDGNTIKMSTLNSTFFHIFIVLPFCTIRSLFYCIFSLLGSAIVRLPLLPASHAPYFRSYASCFTSSSNSSPAE